MDPIEELLRNLDTAPPGDDLDRGIADIFERRTAQARRRRRWNHGLALFATLCLGLGLGYGWGYTAAPTDAPTDQPRSVTYILPVTSADREPLLDVRHNDDTPLSGPVESWVDLRLATSS